MVKTCKKVECGEVLEGACLTYETDPIDTFSIVWRVYFDETGGNMGVTLTTENARRPRAVRAYEENVESEGWWTRMEDSTPRPWSFTWSMWSLPEGGGEGYELRNVSIPLSYGDVMLQEVRKYYERMTPRKHATQLVPNYLSSHYNAPESSNMCYSSETTAEPAPQDNAQPGDAPSGQPTDPTGGEPTNPPSGEPNDPPNDQPNDQPPGGQPGRRLTDLPACSDGDTQVCVQLKLRPAPLRVTEKHTVASPWQTFFGVMGGIYGLLMLAIGMLHTGCTKLCGSRLPLCRPTESETAAKVGAIDA